MTTAAPFIFCGVAIALAAAAACVPGAKTAAPADQRGVRPELRTNIRGEKIIVYPDGSWRYFNDPQGSTTLFAAGDTPDVLTQAEEDRYPVFSDKVLPYREAIDLSAEDARKIGERKIQLAQEATRIARQRMIEARANTARLEQAYHSAEQSPSMPPELLARQRQRLETARETEKLAVRDARLTEEELRRLETAAARNQLLPELIAQQRGAEQRQNTSTDILAGNFYVQVANLDRAIGLGGLGPAAPEAPPCVFAIDGRDEQTGLARRELERQILFTHAEESLRPYLQGKEYLVCEGAMLSVGGGYRFLQLEFHFGTPNAIQLYGDIVRKSYLVIHLLDGQSVYLAPDRIMTPHFDPVRELVVYRARFPISSSVINALKKTEIENMRVPWSRGPEEYSVYNMDFFINQIRCLER